MSVIVTFYNEQDIARQFHEALLQSLLKIKSRCEVIYVNDGSRDQTLPILKELIAASPVPARLLELRRNYGQTAGLQAGFDHARGAVIIAMDGDLQHDPAEIPRFLEKIAEGYDVVSGWREKRIDNFFIRRLPSLLANRFMAAVSGIELHDFGTTFKAYRSEIVQDINLYGDLHRFIPVLAAQVGARICEIPIKNIVRPKGKSKYGLSRTARVFFDIMTLAFFMSYSTRPMHFWGRLGLLFFMAGSGLLSYIVLDYVIWHNDFRGTMQLAVMLTIMGIQFFATGLILEYLTRIHYEATDKKIYAVRQIYKNAAVKS
ncbi:MAG: glycosyltransferase family 2 protein [Candidatus Omnitrophica bacterium]|nr:glycosyltransferase family 2 protein [Candidatus Omnitrophota bacterium]